MENNFGSNFFRKDLNLRGRWWHRLFAVLFFLTFFITIVATSISLYAPKHKNVGPLSERITPELKTIGDLLMQGEKVGIMDSEHGLNLLDNDHVLNDIYCSTNLSSYVEKIANERSIGNLYLSDSLNIIIKKDRKNVSADVFSNYLIQNDINCLSIGTYTESGKKVSFINPGEFSQKNYSIYKESLFNSIFAVLPILFFTTLGFLVFVVLYYKAFLYIVFGSKKME